MSTLFFLMSLFFGWVAWNLYHPNTNHKHFSVFSWFVGWISGELAPHVIFWQAISVAFFVLIGAVWGFFGALGFLICMAAWATMAYFYHDSARAREEVADGLIEGLGEDYLDSIDEEFQAQFGYTPDHDLIRHPFRHPDPGVALISNVGFGDFGQKLDIRKPAHTPEDASMPVLLHIHGGAWTMGAKDDGQGIPLMNHMAKRNWICVSSSYRLSPSATFPDHIIDCKQALVWIKEHIAEYGGNPDFIVVTGGSAGGHLTSLLTLSANYEAFQPGFEDKDTSVQGMVPFYGVYDFTDAGAHFHGEGITGLLEDSVIKLNARTNEDAYLEASPLHHLSDAAPPALVIQGTLDSLVPRSCAEEFVEKLRETSNNAVAYIECKNAQHAFDVTPSIRSEYVKFGVERFLAWTYSRYLNS